LPRWRLAYYATAAVIVGVPHELLNPCAVDGGKYVHSVVGAEPVIVVLGSVVAVVIAEHSAT
jgi:hypothetical protein